MSSSGVIVFTFVIVLLLVVSLSLINFSMPLLKKIELQAIGKEYFAVLEANGGLTAFEVNELESKLISRGYINPSVISSIVNNVRYGDELRLVIETDYRIKTYSGFDSSDMNLEIDFEMNTLNRRIEN